MLQSVNETPTQRLATLLLRQPLDEWVARRRADGASWQAIADELAKVTKDEVTVTRESLRGWYVDAERAAS